MKLCSEITSGNTIALLEDQGQLRGEVVNAVLLPDRSPCSFPCTGFTRRVFHSAFMGAEAEAAPRRLSSHVKLLEGPELQRWDAMWESGLLDLHARMLKQACTVGVTDFYLLSGA